jgi:DNA polymerase (family 10)
MMKKQSTLFPEHEVTVLTELNLKEAEEIAEQIKAAVASHCEKIEVAGSIRRQKPTVHDIDFVAIAKNDAEWQKITEELKRMKAKLRCSGNSVTKAVVPFEKGFFKVDFYRAQPNTWGIHLLVRTGSAEHNTWLATQAISKGMRIKYSQGLTKDGNVIAGETEQSVFEALSLPTPEPSQREIVGDKPIWMPSSETK